MFNVTALLANIGLVLKYMTVTDPQAYNSTELIAVVKRLIAHA
jgi:hypothetical protein